MITPDDRLAQTLLSLEPALAHARHEWWVISSAAVALHLGGGLDVADVDVLLDERDVPAICGALGLTSAPGQGTDLFRSRSFATWQAAPLAVELFAGFELCEAGQWNPVLPKSRVEIGWRGGRAFVPELEELAGLLLRFGRQKDRQRAALLTASARSPSRSGSA